MTWLYELDQTLFKAVHVGMHRDWLDPVFLFFSYLGLGSTEVIVSLLLLFHPKIRPHVVPALLSVLVGGVFVADAIKQFGVDRERPSNLSYALPQEAFFSRSFPSGHTTDAFALAFYVFLVTRGGPKAWVGWLSLVAASLVGMSRVYRGVHWPTDTLGGAFAGMFAASLVVYVIQRFGSRKAVSSD